MIKNTGDTPENQGGELWLDDRGLPIVEDVDADNATRRRHELFLHLRSDLSYPVRVLCRVVLGRLDEYGYSSDPEKWCTAGVERLARDVGVSASRLNALLAEAEEAGVLHRRKTDDGYLRTTVYVPATEPEEEWVKTLWYRTRPSAPLREWKTEIADANLLGDADAPLPLVDRIWWCRYIRDHPELNTTTKAVAFGLDALLRRQTGLAARKTTVDELSALAGCWDRVVRRELQNLEERRLLQIRRRQGRGGGLYLRATLSRDTVEEMYERYAHV